MDAPLTRGLKAQQLSVRVGTRALVENLSVEFAPGKSLRFWGVTAPERLLLSIRSPD